MAAIVMCTASWRLYDKADYHCTNRMQSAEKTKGARSRTDKAGLPARRLPAPPEPETGARGCALKKRESRNHG